MPSIRSALVVYLTSWFAVAAPARVHASERSADSPPANEADLRCIADIPTRLSVRVEPTIGDAALIEKWIAERGREQLEILGIEHSSRPQAEREVALSIGGDDYDYTVTTAMRRHGEPLGEPRSVTCSCTKTDLVKFAATQFVHALQSELWSDPPRFDRRRAASTRASRPLGSLGIAGITIAVVGTLTAATGVGLLATGEKVSSGADAEFAEIANYRPPGGVLLGVGLAAAVAGVALIAVDRSRARRESLTVIVPSGGSSAVGISLLRRF